MWHAYRVATGELVGTFEDTDAFMSWANANSETLENFLLVYGDLDESLLRRMIYFARGEQIN